MVSSSVDLVNCLLYVISGSGSLKIRAMTLVHLITGTPNDLILQNNCYKAANLYYLEISKAPERLKISG